MDYDVINVHVRVARTQRDLDGTRIVEAERPVLEDHAQLVVDDVLRTEFVVPIVVVAPQLQRDQHLGDGVDLLEGLVALLPALDPPACLRVVDVANELVQVAPAVTRQGELVPERRTEMDFVEPFLVESFNVDVGGDGVPLRFCVRQPRGAFAFDPRVVDASAPFPEWAVDGIEAPVSIRFA